MTASPTEHAVCLGCGCACDDITVTVSQGRILGAANACPLGLAWYGDGAVPDDALLGGAPVSLAAAVQRVAELLAGGSVLVYLAPELTTEAQREAIALADRARARLDSVTSDTAAAGTLAGQRRGRAAATLGEVRNRADLLVIWAVDPAVLYPRYLSRYAVDPVGTHVPAGRAGRTIVAVDVGTARGPGVARDRLALSPEREVAALAVMRATVLGRELSELEPDLAAAAGLARRMMKTGYVVIVHDAEPGPAPTDPQRAEGLVGLAQALNGPTRCALSSLRAGGNRSGADAALTWQTGFPFAVDFSAGVPRYRSDEPASVAVGRVASVLIVGAADRIPEAVERALGGRRVAVVGPRASKARFPADVAIDTGVPGIHEAGLVYRMDDVPLPAPRILSGPRTATAVLRAVGAALAPSPASSGPR